jgi:hypothetical protein
LSTDGKSIEGELGSVTQACTPGLAVSNGTTLLIWHRAGSTGTVEGRLISADGQTETTVPIATGMFPAEVGDYVDLPRVVGNDAAGFLVTVRRTSTGDVPSTWVEATRLNTSGSVGPTAVVGYGYDRFDAEPVVVGNDFAIAWTSFGDAGPTVFVRAFTLESKPPPLAVAGGVAIDQRLAVASDGARILIVWQDQESHRLMGAFAAKSATSAETPFAITKNGTLAFEPTLTFDGEQFLLVWADAAGGAKNLWLTRITPQGDVRDPNGIVVSNEPGNESSPSLLVRDSDESLLAYSRFDSTASALRIRTRALTKIEP